MIIIGIALLIVSAFGFLISCAIYTVCLSIEKLLEVFVNNYEERKSINITNKKSTKK